MYTRHNLNHRCEQEIELLPQDPPDASLDTAEDSLNKFKYEKKKKKIVHFNFNPKIHKVVTNNK